MALTIFNASNELSAAAPRVASLEVNSLCAVRLSHALCSTSHDGCCPCSGPGESCASGARPPSQVRQFRHPARACQCLYFSLPGVVVWCYKDAVLQLGLASLASCPPAHGIPPYPTLQAHCRVAYSAHDSKPIAAKCPRRARGLIQRFRVLGGRVAPKPFALSRQARWKGEMVELSWEPRATVFKNFLTPEECDTLIALACPFTRLMFLSC